MLDPDYTRVFPRDLFNEGNLLKCLGQLALFIHDGVVTNIRMAPDEDGGAAMQLAQNQDDGSLVVANLRVWRERDGRQESLHVWRPLNSRQLWPLVASPQSGCGTEFYVFTSAGHPSAELLAWDLGHMPTAGT